LRPGVVFHRATTHGIGELTMMLRRRFQDPECYTPGAPDAAGGIRGLVPAAEFDEMLARALKMMAAAAPERTPPPSSPGSPRPFAAVFYVDVDRFDLAAAGLTGAAIECALAQIGRRLASWAGRTGAVTCRGDDHFVLLRRPGSRAVDGDEHPCEYDGDACERALADLRRHVHRPLLIAGRRLCVSGRVDVVDITRAASGRWDPASMEIC
jgi:hypothetical protein